MQDLLRLRMKIVNMTSYGVDYGELATHQISEHSTVISGIREANKLKLRVSRND